MGRTTQTVSRTEFAVFQRAFVALSEKVVSQDARIEALTEELSTLKALFEDFQKVPGDDESTQCYKDDVADLNDFENDGIPMGIPQDDEDDGIPMGIPQDDEAKKAKKAKKAKVKKVLSPEVILLKASYKTLYGSGPRGRSCNSETWLRQKIALKDQDLKDQKDQKDQDLKDLKDLKDQNLKDQKDQNLKDQKDQMRPVDGSGFLCSPPM